jgi:hypothetical protein
MFWIAELTVVGEEQSESWVMDSLWILVGLTEVKDKEGWGCSSVSGTLSGRQSTFYAYGPGCYPQHHKTKTE